MTRLLFHTFNTDHFGTGADYSGDNFTWPPDYDRVIRDLTASEHFAWPDVLVLGEADRCEMNGGQGMFDMAEAIEDAGGPAYMPMPGSLGWDGGPFGPLTYVNLQSIRIRRHFHFNLSDFSDRNQNLGILRLPGRKYRFRIVPVHGQIHFGHARLHQCADFDRFARHAIPCVLIGDFNSEISGREPGDFDSGAYGLGDLASRKVWRHGPQQEGPHIPDTEALDYLCGWLNPDTQRREGGIGFYDVSELAGRHIPTLIERSGDREEMCVDRILVNKAWRHNVLPETYRVHVPRNPEQYKSDHYGVSVQVELMA